MIFDFRPRCLGAVALGVTFMGGVAAGMLTVNPAVAAGIVSAVTTVSCSVTGAKWCISGNNSSSGIGPKRRPALAPLSLLVARMA